MTINDLNKIAYIVSEEKTRDLDGVVATTNLALSELISNALPVVKVKDSNNKSGLMAIGENVCILYCVYHKFKLYLFFNFLKRFYIEIT